MDLAQQLFVVTPYSGSNDKVVVWSASYEEARRVARSWFGNYPGEINPHDYIVTPITEPGDRVKFDITLNI